MLHSLPFSCHQVARASVQLSNADKLISGLGGEAKSWEDQVRATQGYLDTPALDDLHSTLGLDAAGG